MAEDPTLDTLVFPGLISVVRRVNSVKIIEADRGEIARSGGIDIVGRGLRGRQRRANIRVSLRGLRFKFRLRRERHISVQVVTNFKLIVEIREEEHGKVQTGIQQSEFCFLKLAAAVLGLQVRLDDVGMSHFPALFEGQRKLQKLFARIRGSCRGLKLFFSGGGGEVILHNRDDQAPGSDLRSRLRCCR